MVCGYCHRRMQGNWSRNLAHYRCRYPEQYALANTIEHPRNVYLTERDVLPALDGWLAQAFTPANLEQTIETLTAAQPDTDIDPDPRRRLDRRGPGPQSPSLRYTTTAHEQDEQ